MYKAVLFAPDGAWVTDYRGCRTIAEVQDRLVDRGTVALRVGLARVCYT